MSNTKKNKKRISLRIIFTVFFLLVSLLPFTTLVNADVQKNGYNIPSSLPNDDSKSNIINGGESSQFTSDKNSISKYITDDTTNIGFDILYGSSRSTLIYKGEVSPEVKNPDGYRQRDDGTIENIDRVWGNGKDEKKIPSHKDGINRTDLHWFPMMISAGGNGILRPIMNFFYNIASNIMGWLITFSAMDLSTISKAITDGGLPDILSSIFLWDKNGTFSPLLIISLCGFMIGIISLSISAIKGRSSLKNLLQELGFLILAMMLALFVINPYNENKISSSMMNIANNLSNNIVASTSDKLDIFKTTITSDGTTSVISTQKGFLNANYVNAWIRSETGYSPASLDTNKFGSAKDIKAWESNLAIYKGKPYNTDGTFFRVTTSTDAKTYVDNLGYYLYAAFSNVKTWDGNTDHGSYPWIVDDDGKSGRALTADDGGGYDYGRTLWVIDFLNQVHNSKDTSANTKAKTVNIVNTLANPSVNNTSFAMSLLLLVVLYVAMVVALFHILGLLIGGKLIIMFGVYAMVVMPILILIPKTRSICKKMCTTYIMAFLRFAAGSIMFNTLFAVSTILAMQGNVGIVVAIIVVCIFGKYSGTFTTFLNRNLDNVAGRMHGEFQIARKMETAFNQRKQKYEVAKGQQLVRDRVTGEFVQKQQTSRMKNFTRSLEHGDSLGKAIKFGMKKYNNFDALTNKGDLDVVLNEPDPKAKPIKVPHYGYDTLTSGNLDEDTIKEIDNKINHDNIFMRSIPNDERFAMQLDKDEVVKDENGKDVHVKVPTNTVLMGSIAGLEAAKQFKDSKKKLVLKTAKGMKAHIPDNTVKPKEDNQNKDSNDKNNNNQNNTNAKSNNKATQSENAVKQREQEIARDTRKRNKEAVNVKEAPEIANTQPTINKVKENSVLHNVSNVKPQETKGKFIPKATEKLHNVPVKFKNAVKEAPDKMIYKGKNTAKHLAKRTLALSAIAIPSLSNATHAIDASDKEKLNKKSRKLTDYAIDMAAKSKGSVTIKKAAESYADEETKRIIQKNHDKYFNKQGQMNAKAKRLQRKLRRENIAIAQQPRNSQLKDIKSNIKNRRDQNRQALRTKLQQKEIGMINNKKAVTKLSNKNGNKKFERYIDKTMEAKKAKEKLKPKVNGQEVKTKS